MYIYMKKKEIVRNSKRKSEKSSDKDIKCVIGASVLLYVCKTGIIVSIISICIHYV